MIGAALWFYVTDVFDCDYVLRFNFILQISIVEFSAPLLVLIAGFIYRARLWVRVC